MSGQPLYERTHWQKCDEPPSFIRAVRGHTTSKANPQVLSHGLAEKGFTTFLYHLGIPKNEYSIISVGSVPSGLERDKFHARDDVQAHRCFDTIPPEILESRRYVR